MTLVIVSLDVVLEGLKLSATFSSASKVLRVVVVVTLGATVVVVVVRLRGPVQ